MDERPDDGLEVIAGGDPDAPRRRPPRWALALGCAVLGGAAVLASGGVLAGKGPADDPPRATPSPGMSPSYVTSGLPPPYDVHGPLEGTSPRERVLVALPDGSYVLPGQEQSGRQRFGGELVGAFRDGAGFVVFDGRTVRIAPSRPGDPARTATQAAMRTVARTSWYLGTAADRVYVALRAGGRPVVRALREDGSRAGADLPLPPGSLEPGGWLPRTLVGEPPAVVAERLTNRPGPGRDIAVLRPDGSVDMVMRDALLAGVADTLVLTKRGGPDETTLCVTRITAGGLDQYDLALPRGWRLAPEGAAVSAGGVIAFPVYAVVDATVTGVAYATAADRTAWLVPGSYRASPQAGLAGDERHLVFPVETAGGMRLAVWHPPAERSARYLAGTVPEGGRLTCRPGAEPCGYLFIQGGAGPAVPARPR